MHLNVGDDDSYRHTKFTLSQPNKSLAQNSRRSVNKDFPPKKNLHREKVEIQRPTQTFPQ